MIAGELRDVNDQHVGYKSAVLVNVETGETVADKQQGSSPEALGIFYFRQIDSGTYTIEFLDNSGTEIPIEPFQVILGVGDTKAVILTVLPD